jgi:hypothetical protein
MSETNCVDTPLVGGPRDGTVLPIPDDCNSLKMALPGCVLTADGGIRGEALLYERGEDASIFLYRGVLSNV